MPPTTKIEGVQHRPQQQQQQQQQQQHQHHNSSSTQGPPSDYISDLDRIFTHDVDNWREDDDQSDTDEEEEEDTGSCPPFFGYPSLPSPPPLPNGEPLIDVNTLVLPPPIEYSDHFSNSVLSHSSSPVQLPMRSYHSPAFSPELTIATEPTSPASPMQQIDLTYGQPQPNLVSRNKRQSVDQEHSSFPSKIKKVDMVRNLCLYPCSHMLYIRYNLDC